MFDSWLRSQDTPSITSIDGPQDSERKPLLIKGARQVGKTYLARELDKQFEFFLEINFLSDKKAHAFFDEDLEVG